MALSVKEAFSRCKRLFFKRIDRYSPWSHLRLTSAFCFIVWIHYEILLQKAITFIRDDLMSLL